MVLGRIEMHSVDTDAKSLIHEGRVAYVTVDSRRGPHVTPFLYAFGGGRFWFLGAADTLTVRLTDAATPAGVQVRAGSGDVVLTGTLQRIDAFRLADVAREGRGLLHAPPALARYALRNAPDLIGFGRDALRGNAGRLPPTRRVLLRFDPERELVVDGQTVTPPGPVRPTASTTAGAPPPDREPDGGSVSAVLAVHGDDGPIAMPVRWDAAARRGWVAAALADATGLRAGAGAVGLGAYGAPGPAAKTGRMVRGEVELCDAYGQWRAFRVAPDRITRWSGVHAETRRFA
jgi:hypothetical protein